MSAGSIAVNLNASDLPLPCQHLDHSVRKEVGRFRVEVRATNVCKRVRKGSCRTPRHGEHHVQRYSQCFCTVHVSEAGRICDDGFCYERHSSGRIRLDARPPTSVQYLGYHRTFRCNISSHDGREFGDDAWVLHHILEGVNVIFGSTSDSRSLQPLDQKDRPRWERTRDQIHAQNPGRHHVWRCERGAHGP
jgi:hypothetical protein